MDLKPRNKAIPFFNGAWLKKGSEPQNYFLVVRSPSRRLESRLQKYANLIFKGCFANGLAIYHVKVESLEMLRRLKISLKQLEHNSQSKILKLKPLMEKEDVIFMIFLHGITSLIHG